MRLLSSSSLVVGVLVSVGLIVQPFANVSATAARASGDCASVRSSLSLDNATSKARVAEYKVLVERERRQMSVAQKYGDSKAVVRLNASLQIDEPRYLLALKQRGEVAASTRLITRCDPEVVDAVANGISRRSLIRSLLVANENLRADRSEAGRAWAADDSYPSEATKADLLQARANVLEDKQFIARLKVAIRARA